MKNTTKILFISHSNNLTYGAAKSLKAVLNNIDCQFDFLCTKHLYKVYGEDGIREYAGNNINKIYSFHLPFEDTVIYEYEENPKLINKFKKLGDRWLTRLRYLVDAKKIEQLICDGNYQVVHLNSIVLYPIISKRHKFFIHVREVLSQKRNNQARKKLDEAYGIICIDQVTKDSLPNMNGNIKVMNNPFVMEKVPSSDVGKLREKLNINDEHTILALIGVVNESKGTPFILECLKLIDRQDISILIVGSGPESIVNLCLDIEKNDSRIKYLGEIADINPIYALSDYIIRAEEIFCIGRTVYEGLYAGCDVIMPGNTNTDASKLFERDVFSNRVHFYSPRNKNAFVEVVRKCSKVNKSNRIVMSNLNEYIIKFKNFIGV